MRETPFPALCKIAAVIALSVLHITVLHAAEFEVMDKLTVNGYSDMKSSAQVRGILGVSTGAPQAALDVVSTGTAVNIYAQIWRDSSGIVVASMTSTGVFFADIAGSRGLPVGDSLGTHIATQTLNMGGFRLINAGGITSGGAATIHSSTTVLGLTGVKDLYVGGVSSFTAGAYFTGVSSFSNVANVHYAGGTVGQVLTKVAGGGMQWSTPSSLVSGDSLGAHVATQTLNMAAFPVINMSTIAMLGDGLRISTGIAAGASGIHISTSGEIVTIGPGSGGVPPANRGRASVDLQTGRSVAANVSSGAYSGIAAGFDNAAGGAYSTVSGGRGNSSSSGYSVVGGGYSNISSGENSAILGGRSNTASSMDAVVNGGWGNSANAAASVIAGGRNNTVGGMGSAAISGGNYNSVSTGWSVIAGGEYNTVGGAATGHSSISGGGNNAVIATYGVIAGGQNNYAYNGSYQIIPGGYGNTAGASYSLAAGHASSSTAVGAFTWADSEGVGVENKVQDRALFKTRGGFLVTGSTNSAISGPMNRGFMVTGNGLVGISTGTPYAALDVVSSATASNVYAQIWRDGGGVIKASMTSEGVLFATLPPGSGDNLGNHTATSQLQMGDYAVWSSSTISATAYQIRGSTVLAILPGDGSFALGQEAGISNTASGLYNTFSGYYSGPLNANGSSNSFYGAESGRNNTAGGDNAFFGYDSGYSNTIGSGNAFFGSRSGYDNKTGSRNTISGLQAGYFNQSGSANTLMGNLAGYGTWMNSFSSSTIVGYKAGYSLSTGSDNTFIGWQSGYNVTTGTGNIIIGYDARTPAADYNNHLNIGGAIFGNLGGGGKTIGIGQPAQSAALDVKSTDTASGVYAQIWRDGAGVVRASMTSTGVLYATLPPGSGDNLGNHTATSQLKMGNFAVNSSSAVSAAYYQINGSTVLAVLPGTQSMALGVDAGRVSRGGWNSFAGYQAGYFNNTGGDNTFFGNSAGYSNVSAGYSSYFGDHAGYASIGAYNDFIGAYAGYNNTTGNNNLFLGNFAGYGITSGVKNVIAGANAAYGNIGAGSANTVLGWLAGYGQSSTYYSSSTILGYNAGFNLFGNDNIFVGWQAGYNVTSGTGNIVIGYNDNTSAPTASNELVIGEVLFGKLDAKTIGISTRAPQAALDIVSTGTLASQYAQIWRDGSGVIVGSMSATGVLKAVKILGDISGASGLPAGDNLGDHTATQQLKMGNYALWSSSAITAAYYQIHGSTVISLLGGSGSISVGPNSGGSNTGNNNVFVGSGSGRINTSGDHNTFVGAQAGYSNNGGRWNIFLGDSSGYSNNSGNENTFVGGYMTGYSNSSGYANTFLGNYSGQSNTSGYSNTFLGYIAGEFNTTGVGNSFVGQGAGDSNVTGSYNAAIGFEAGYNGSNSSSGTLAGYRAGYNLSNGYGNTFLGWQAGYTTSSGVRNIVVGYDQRASAPTASDELNLGGVLYGKLDAKTIGISTRAPQAALDIVSTGTLASQYAQIWRDSNGVPKASMTADGTLYVTAIGKGDNLGNHTATQDLNLSANDVLNVGSITIVGKGLQIATDLTSSGSGIFISTGGAIQTTGAGHGTVTGNARGNGAVDLQTFRAAVGDIASGEYSVISGGYSNKATANYSTVSGGYSNSAGNNVSTVGGGFNNNASGSYSTVGGGYSNTASGDANVVAGGNSNSSSGTRSSIGGGYLNSASMLYSVVSGGTNNNASNNYSAVGGGTDNIASGDSSVVSGGQVNTASGYKAVVGGGGDNTASGLGSVVPGGVLNTAFGVYSWAGGYKSSSTASGSFTWSDSAGVLNLNSVVNRTVFKNSGGFLITGSTNTVMSGTADRGLFVTGSGLVGISTGTPYAALDVVSTGTTNAQMAQIWRNSGGTIVSSMSATGVMMAAKFVGDGSALTNLSANAGVYTLAQMNVLAPPAAGRLISISDATAPYSYCVSTGTAVGSWVLLNQTIHCQ